MAPRNLLSLRSARMTPESKRLRAARVDSERAARLFEADELTEAQLWRILESEEDALIAVTRKREASVTRTATNCRRGASDVRREARR